METCDASHGFEECVPVMIFPRSNVMANDKNMFEQGMVKAASTAHHAMTVCVCV